MGNVGIVDISDNTRIMGNVGIVGISGIVSITASKANFTKNHPLQTCLTFLKRKINFLHYLLLILVFA